MKVHRLRYSPYARKVEKVLDLLGQTHELVEVRYGDREELAELTSGSIVVPVLVTDAGEVLRESRAICEELLRRHERNTLVPSPLEGPIWAYHDFVDGPLEDVLFRIASPAVRDAWTSAFERALYVYIKERKFGAGCVDAWLRDRDTLLERARAMLAPTLATLARVPFVFGDSPTLADAALYGCCVMLDEADPSLLPRISPALVAYVRRVDEIAPVLGRR